MRTLATLQEPETGSARMGNLDVLQQKHALRKVLGYLPQEFGVPPRISAQEALDHMAVLKGYVNAKERHEIVDAMLHRINLYAERKKALASFSGGMRQRFGIGQALLGNPQLLIVDEPTAGLDPGERNRFYNLLSEVGENVTVILSTHIVQDVMQLCTNMAIIHQGKVLFAGVPDQAVKNLSGKIWQKFIAKSDVKDAEQKYRVFSSKLIGGRPLIHIYADENPGNGFEPVAADLEDVFFTSISRLQ